MKRFEDCNPVTVFLYFVSVTATAMFCGNPLITLISLCGAVTLSVFRDPRAGFRSHALYIPLFLIMAIVNPLFYHNGVTVLFVLNGNPVTLEATLYGVCASALIVAVLYWFRSFSRIMTEDKLLYLFGKVSPKLALLLSMTLRYVPLFGAQVKKVSATQKALGLYKDGNAVDSVRGFSRVFSVMVTWALENGIITADSMAARGYGSGKRTFFALYRFRRGDVILCGVMLALLAVTLAGILSGTLSFGFYPSVTPLRSDFFACVSYVSYAVTVLIPVIVDVTEEVKWKRLLSRI